MNEEQRRNEGHLLPGCSGDWIDVSSLAASAWTCPVCRAIIPSLEALDEPAELPPAPSKARLWLWLALAGLATAVGAALILAIGPGLRGG